MAIMSKYIELIETFLTNDDWSYNTCTTKGGNVYLRSPYTAKHSNFDIVFDASDSQDLVMIFIYPTIHVPNDKQSQIAELVCRINQRVAVGCFEFDYSDNAIRFKSSIDIEGGEFTSTMFFNMLKGALSIMDKSFPAFMAVLYGDITPETACQRYFLKKDKKSESDVDNTEAVESLSEVNMIH